MVSLVGIAVTPNVSRDLGAMVTEFITGEEIDRYAGPESARVFQPAA